MLKKHLISILMILTFTIATGACVGKKPESIPPAQLSVLGLDESKALFVTPEGVATNDGKSWQTSLDLQTAIDKVSADANKDYVFVSRGVYYADPAKKNSNKFIRLKDGVQIYGGFNASAKKLQRYVDASIFEGELIAEKGTQLGVYSKSVFVGENLSSDKNILDGFVIKNTKTYGSLYGDNYISPISLINSKFKLVNMVFTDNYSKTGGGAINLINNSSLDIKNSKFINNFSYQRSGAIENSNSQLTIKNSSFANNKGFNGGAINSAGSNLKLEEVYFTNNFANNSGGALYGHNSEFKIKNSRFSKNISHNYGGAISQNDSSNKNTLIINSLFQNNIAIYAGAVNIFTGKNVYITNSVFLNNFSSNYGGALLIGDASEKVKVRIFNSIFWNNYNKKTGVENKLNSVYVYRTSIVPEIRNSLFNKESILVKQSNGQNPEDFLNTTKLDFMTETATLKNNQAPESFTVEDNGKVASKNLGLIKNKGDNQAYLQAYDAYLDTTSTTEIPATETALDGEKRLQGEKIDIGAYELQ